MTVAELIEALKTMPQDAVVVGDGYEGGLTALRPPKVERARARARDEDDDDWYWGEFDFDVAQRPDAFDVVFLERGRG